MSTDARSPATESPAETPATSDDAGAPADAGGPGTESPAGRNRWWAAPETLSAVTLVVGLLGLVAALLMPFAPVLDHDTTVTWPRAGEDPASTTAFFVPYAPESLRVDVPCRVVRTAADRDGPTTIVSSDTPGSDTTGFAVTTADRSLLVLVGGRQIYRAPVPDGDACGLVLSTDGNGSTVTAGGAAPRSFPGDRVRNVRVFATELAPPDAAGLRVQARTADWFTADPTATKDALATVALLLAAASLALLALADRRRRRRRTLAATTRIWRARALESWATVRGAARKAADVVVVATLGVWTVIGPLSPDDGFTEGIVRNAAGTDQFGNFYRWENASEAPFTLVLRLVQPLVDDAATPLALRTLSTLAGVGVWLLVSRVALPVLLGRHARLVWVRMLLAVCLLVWWMPLNLGVRPEPFAALAVTATVAFGLRAAARPRHGGVWLGLAALAFGLAMAVTPSSVMVLGPVLVLLPALLRRVRGTAAGARGLLAGAGGIAAAAAIGGVGLVVMFSGQSWYTVTRATEMHAYYGPNVPWFDEIRRWTLLLGLRRRAGRARPPDPGPADDRAAGHRAPAARAGGAPLDRPAVGAGGDVRCGARAAPALADAVEVDALLRHARRCRVPGARVRCRAAGAGRPPARRRDGGAGGGGRRDGRAGRRRRGRVRRQERVVPLLALGRPARRRPVPAVNTPVPWVLVVVAVLAVGALAAAVRTGDNRAGARDGLRRAVVRAPAVLTVAVAVVGVAVMLWSFAAAPERQAGSYSVGAQMVAHLERRADLRHARRRRRRRGHARRGARRRARAPPQTAGFTQNGGYRGKPPAPPGHRELDVPVGLRPTAARSPPATLTSQWFVLRMLADDQELALDVNGRTGQGNALSLEFAPPGDGSAPP